MRFSAISTPSDGQSAVVTVDFEVKAVDNYKHATPAGIYTTPLDLTW